MKHSFLNVIGHKYLEETQCVIGPYNPSLIITNDHDGIWRAMDFVSGCGKSKAEYDKSF